MSFRKYAVILISNLTSPSVNFFQYTSHSKIFLLYAPKNVVRENFHFGSGSKKFPNQNEKIPVPVFSKTQTKISRITVRKIRSGKWDETVKHVFLSTFGTETTNGDRIKRNHPESFCPASRHSPPTPFLIYTTLRDWPYRIFLARENIAGQPHQIFSSLLR